MMDDNNVPENPAPEEVVPEETAPEEMTPEEAAKEEAQAEEEFVSAPEDTLENPLVPEQKDDSDDAEDRLEGAIGSGDLETDYPEETNAVNNEQNLQGEEPAVEPEVNEAKEEEVPAEEQKSTVFEEPKKKSKKGLIITLVIVFLLLIGGGAAFLIWVMIHEQPNVAIHDALVSAAKAENLKAEGVLTSNANDSDNTINFVATKVGNSIALNGDIVTKPKTGDEMKFKYAGFYGADDKIYFKIDGIEDMTKNAGLSELLSGLAGEEMASMLTSVLGAVVKQIDGQWFKVKASDINSFNAEYGCILGNLGKILSSDTLEAIADAYEDNQFLSVDEGVKAKSEDGASVYTVKLDEGKKDSFKKKASENKTVSDILSCGETKTSSSNSSNKVSLSSPTLPGEENGEVREYERQLKRKEEGIKRTLQIGVKPFSHELSKVEMTTDDTETKTTLTAKVSYEKGEISEPSDAKTTKDLESAIQKSITSAYQSWVDAYVRNYCAKSEPNNTKCIEQQKGQAGGIDAEQIFDIFSSGIES